VRWSRCPLAKNELTDIDCDSSFAGETKWEYSRWGTYSQMHDMGCRPDTQWRQGRLAVDGSRPGSKTRGEERRGRIPLHTGRSGSTAAELRVFSGRLESDIITLQRKENIASELDHTFAQPPHHHLRPLPANPWSQRSAEIRIAVSSYNLFTACYRQQRGYI
jgi:hypothetical protein